MNLQELSLLVDYHYWARDRVLDAAQALSVEQFTRDMGSSFKSVRDTLAHVYFAEWIWYSRWQGNSPSKGRDATEFADAGSLAAAWRELEAEVRSFLEGLSEQGIQRTMEYRLLNGQPGTSIVWQMVQHVVNHASYHRGQVTTMLRQLGARPPRSMDLITFYRERS
jgi:uncharacterized damage-inducible protein DinB